MDWERRRQKHFCQRGCLPSHTMILIIQVDSIHDTTSQELLEVLKTGTHPSALADLSKRKLIEKRKIYFFSVEKGDEFTRDIRKQETDISVEMLQKFPPLPPL